MKDSVKGFADGESIGLDEDRVARRAEGRDGAFAVELVTAKDLGEEILPRTSFAARRELFLSAARALGRLRPGAWRELTTREIRGLGGT